MASLEDGTRPNRLSGRHRLTKSQPHVERLTFEEFFNHPFLSQAQPSELPSHRKSSKITDGFPFSEHSPARFIAECSQEDSLPFSLDDDSSGPDGSPSTARIKPPVSTYGFEVERKEAQNTSYNRNLTPKHGNVTNKPENSGFRLDIHRSSEGHPREHFKSMERRPIEQQSRVVDSLELIDQDYVIVSGPPMDGSSSSAHASNVRRMPGKFESPQQASEYVTSTSSAPVPILGITSSRGDCMGSLDSHSSAPSGTSQGSMDIGDALEQPSTDCMTRIKSLQRCASAISELVKEKVGLGRQLEAFSIQLVILAIWKQALHVCHTQAVSAIEGSPTQDMARFRENTGQGESSPDVASSRGPQDICFQIEKEFLVEVGNAEELSKAIEHENTEMPDAMETIYQSALALGRHGCVDEYMGDTDNAATYYSKAVSLLVFLLVEAPSLILNPPFSLTNSDRYRLRTYIEVLNNRQSHSRSQRMALLKCEDQQCPP